MAKQHFGNKLVGSIGWLLLGIIVFIGSFVLLYYSEGRTDYTDVAATAVDVEEAADSKDFVYVTRELDTPVFLGDGMFLYEDEYLVVDRTVEMYSWVEEVETEDDEKVYTYGMQWVEEVPDSNEFKQPRGHENLTKPIRSEKYKTNEASVGIYKIDMDEIGLPGTSPLKLNEDILMLDEYQQIIKDDKYDYIFDGYGTYEEPEIGDLRIRYEVLEPMDEVTVFGRVADEKIGPHHGEAEKKLYRVFKGTKEDAMSVLKGEYTAAGWMGRIGGFILMWIGLMFILSPLSTAMELIPFLREIGKGALTMIAFVIALILTIVATIAFAILHNTVALIIIIVVAAAIGYYLYTKPPKKSAAKH